MVESFSLYLTLQLEYDVARTLFELRPDNFYKQQVPVDFQNLLQ